MPRSSSSPNAHPPPRHLSRSVIEHANLDKKAYEILKSMLLERRLPVGEKIPQEQLASDLGISRTPLINALKLLEKEHLVEARPRRGYVVRAFGTRDMLALFELREVLEGLAARKATERITPAQKERLRRFFSTYPGKRSAFDLGAYAREDESFHSFIIETAGHQFLGEILDAHNVVHASYQTTASAAGLVRPPADTIGEHRAIIEAVCQGDAAGAEHLMRAHLAKTANVLREKLAQETGIGLSADRPPAPTPPTAPKRPRKRVEEKP